MRKLLALLRRRRTRKHSWHADTMAHIPAWSELGRAAIAIHIADASNTRKGRKGWATLGGAG